MRWEERQRQSALAAFVRALSTDFEHKLALRPGVSRVTLRTMNNGRRGGRTADPRPEYATDMGTRRPDDGGRRSVTPDSHRRARVSQEAPCVLVVPIYPIAKKPPVFGRVGVANVGERRMVGFISDGGGKRGATPFLAKVGPPALRLTTKPGRSRGVYHRQMGA